MARKATLTEIETCWSLCDLMDCNEAMDIEDELEKEAYDKAKAEAERK